MEGIEDSLNKQVKRANDTINQYKADIEKYNQGILDAKKSKQIFCESVAAMDSMIIETAGVFEGSAAMEFCSKLRKYNKAVKKIPAIMDKRIKSFERRIREIQAQKHWCEMWNNVLNGLLTAFKSVNV